MDDDDLRSDLARRSALRTLDEVPPTDRTVQRAAPDPPTDASSGVDSPSNGAGNGQADDDSKPITAPTLPGQPPLKARRTPPRAPKPERSRAVPATESPTDTTDTADTDTADTDTADTDSDTHIDAGANGASAGRGPVHGVAAPDAAIDDASDVETASADAAAADAAAPVAPPAPPDAEPVRRTPELYDAASDLSLPLAIDAPSPPVAKRTVVDAERHLIAPVTRATGRRPRVRRVTRVLRHIDPWSVFKISAVFSVVLYGVTLTAGVLLWNVAYSTGTIDNVEQFFESFGWSSFEFEGGEIYHSAWVGGLFVIVALTGFAVLGATLFNLITDLVGGVRMTVLEEEMVERTESPTRQFTVRRTTGQRPEGETGTAVEEHRSDR